jgi:hypothetical protein
MPGKLALTMCTLLSSQGPHTPEFNPPNQQESLRGNFINLPHRSLSIGRSFTTEFSVDSPS